MAEAGKQGVGISLSDYTLGFGQGYMVDELLRDHPEVRGMELKMGKDDKVVPQTLPWSLNPMHPMSGKWYAERFFGQFEKRIPGEGGKGLNFFFSDELAFGVSGRMWSDGFAEEFRKRKGYDIVPELTALFKDTGPRTPKVRMDYSTHGGWWEWAPPDNTFRMPYWKHLKGFMDCQQRLAYLLSQGHYRCDVAILYPVAAVQAGMDGKMAVDTAFKTGQGIYAKGIDFDFMDFESLARAEVVGKELHVAGNIYKVLVLPAMKAVRHSTLKKAVEFKRAGGLVFAVGALPEASDRIGREDPEVAAMAGELFPNGPTADLASAIPFRDYTGPGYIQHRKIGPRDVYAIYNAPQGSECFFRAKGNVELWDPWTGATKPLEVVSKNEDGTKLRLPLTEKEMLLIVFSPGNAQLAVQAPPPDPPAKIALDGPWEFELKPTLDNRFGDFHWPPTPTLIGAEARRLKYSDEAAANPGWENPAFDDSKWPLVTCGFGPRFWKLGPLPQTAETDAALAALKHVDPVIYVRIGGKDYSWQPYEFSWRYGIENDCAHQGYHGLKIQVADEFIGFGGIRHGHPGCHRVPEAGGSSYYLWTAVQSPKAGETSISSGRLLPVKAWLNGEALDIKAGSVHLSAAGNPLLLRYGNIGRGWFVPGTSPAARVGQLPWNNDLAMCWFKDPKRPVFDTRSQVARSAGWYRFIAPPGLRSLMLPVSGKPQVWADGKALVVSGSSGDWKATLAQPARTSAVVAIRVEQTRGDYGGAAFSDYIRLDCGAGDTPLGDWSKSGVLETYSGGAWYRKTFQLAATQTSSKITLNLGQVAASAEVRVNGQTAGIMAAPPWKLDISAFAKPGENQIEVLVCNTLANHYVTIPTHYRGSTISGLLGPVYLEITDR